VNDQPQPVPATRPGTLPELNNLVVRIISAVVLAAIVLAISWYGGIWFRLFAVVVGAAIFCEWVTMAKAWGKHAIAHGLLLAILLATMAFGTPALGVIALYVGLLIIGRAYDGLTGGRPWPPAGYAYAGLSAVCLGALRGDTMAGLYTVLFLFAAVWATDIAAYFVGRAVGGPKLAPRISPGKTWSGALGGAMAGTLAGAGVAWAFEGPMVLLAIAAFVLSVVSQFGDLFESWVKRRHGAKDSSRLIPGHGGVMDRVDGLVAAAIALYFIAAAMGGPNTPTSVLFPG
jgi:phosphatidate cytidylyltransferase